METQNQFQRTMTDFDHRLRRIENRLKETSPLNTNWVDGPDFCRVFHISSLTLARYRASGILPYSKMGGKYLYLIADAEKYLAARKVQK